MTIALGQSDSDGDRPIGRVVVDFPLLANGIGASREADIVGWCQTRPDGSGDTAVLRLTTPAPEGARPARLTMTDARWGDAVRVIGFPADLPEDYGVWVEAELRARQAAGWLQVESEPARRSIGPGFSGTPVWSPAAGGVVGMVVAAERGSGTTGYLLPTATLVELHPEIATADPAEICPYRGLDPFLEEHADLFQGRDAVVERLDELVTTRPLVVAAGPSGCGKSSLVRAGVIPRLRQRGMQVADFRPTPGARPEDLLAVALMPILEPDVSEVGRHADAQRLADEMVSSRNKTLPWLAGRLSEQATGGLLLFADQVEEMPGDNARALIALLSEMTRSAPRRANGSPTLVAIVTLRSGSLDAVVTDETADMLQRGVFLVPPMGRDQLREAITVADVDFQPGLVDRILDDAGNEPGSLPLVEFTLDRLWSQRRAGMLTHQAYEDLGRVPGALAQYAEHVYLNTIDETQHHAAQRLLVQLARPEPDGSFQRQPVRLSRLDPGLRPVLDRLVASRLVVVSRASDGTEIVDLAHQALVQQWPTLRDLLEQQREFRAWQEQLRSSLSQWEAANHEPSGLLRGTAMATAAKWAAERPGDLTPTERTYVQGSVARDRRRIRVLRTVIAVISALALAAASFAVIAVNQTGVAQARLRTAASRALANDSNRFRSIDPAISLQLAQAAWHEDHTAEAYGALFTQYAALQTVDKVFENLRPGTIDGIAASQDGNVAIVQHADQAPVVWTGFAGDHPQSWTPPAAPHAPRGSQFFISPNGQTLVEADVEGGLWLWDVEHRSAPIELATNQPDTASTTFTKLWMAFSQDSTRLVRRLDLEGQAPETAVWDMSHHTLIPTANAIAPDLQEAHPFFGTDPGTVVLSTNSTTNVYNLTSGQLVRSIPRPDDKPSDKAADIVAENGAVLARCSRADNRVHVIDLGTGIEQRSIPVSLCSGLHDLYVGAAEDYGLFCQDNVGAGDSGSSNSYLSAVDLRSGVVYQLAAPETGCADGEATDTNIVMYSGAGHGSPMALIADQDVLYRVHASGPSMLTGADTRFFTDQNTDYEFVDNVSPDGATAVDYNTTTSRIEVVDAKSNSVITSTPAPPVFGPLLVQNTWWAFTPDGKRLLALEGDSLVVYTVPTPAAPTLTVQGTIDLPMPNGIGPRPSDWQAWAGSVVAVDNTSVVVLHAGVFSRWNLDTGRAVGAPLPLHADVTSEYLAALLAYTSVTVRPGHPQQIAVADPNGSVDLWDLDQRRIIETIHTLPQSQNAVQFDPAGENMAVVTSANVTVWDIERDRQIGQAIPTGYLDEGLLGFTPDHKIVALSTLSNTGAQIWDNASGKLIATLTPPSAARAIRLQGGTLSYWSHEQKRSIALDPAQWFTALCAAVNRPYTDAEKLILEQDDHASTTPPCQ
ncbi:WD40 repeat protein [Catenulispora sp. GAS73]